MASKKIDSMWVGYFCFMFFAIGFIVGVAIGIYGVKTGPKPSNEGAKVVCEDSHAVIANGEFVGCTDDPTNYRGYP